MAINGTGIRAVGRILRRVGAALEGVGRVLQDKDGYVERLVPSTRVVALKGKTVAYGYQHFVASSASLVGDVQLGEHASVWYGATVRGDRGTVSIGRGSSVLDNACVHAGTGQRTRLGNDVVVSTGAVVSAGADIGDGVMIGMGAVVQPGAVIGNDSYIDAGAVVASGTRVPAGQLWTGSPARFLRNMTPDEMSYLRTAASMYGQLAERHQAQGEKSVAAVEDDAAVAEYKLEHGLKPEDTVPTMDADVVEYYKLTTPAANSGLFREREFDVAAEVAQREAEEVAADAAEDAMYAQAERLRRVGGALKALAIAKPAARGGVVAELERLDPLAADMFRDMAARIAAASTSGDAAEKASLLNSIRRVDEGARYYESDKEAVDAAQVLFDAVAKAAPAAGSVVPPAATSASSRSSSSAL